MKSVFKYPVLAIIFGLLLFQSGVNAQDKSAPGGEPESAKSDSSEFPFPKVEGWKNGEVVKTPAGDLVNYDSEAGGRVTLYFYDGILKGMADKNRQNVMKDEMRNAKLGILQLGEMGIYKNIKEEIKDETVMLGGKAGKVKSQHSLLYFSARDEDLVSEIYVFSYKDHLFKIRASRSKTKENDNKALEKFFSELDTRFSK
ncbi:MAG: hypothetical protein ACR2F2_06815 [Pyrinomonadaceae bacterium]